MLETCVRRHPPPTPNIDQESAADLTKALVSIQSYQFRSLCKTDKDIVSLTKLVFIAGLLYLIA